MKLDTIESKRTVEEVALFMRAWIEIISRIPALKGLIVALFMRVWIEMRMDRASKLIICSRPLHEGVY